MKGSKELHHDQRELENKELHHDQRELENSQINDNEVYLDWVQEQERPTFRKD